MLNKWTKRIALASSLLLLSSYVAGSSQVEAKSKVEQKSENKVGVNDEKGLAKEGELAKWAPKAPSKEVTHLVGDKIEDTDFFVNVSWLKEQLKKDPSTVVLEAGYGDKAFKKGHIPGAIRIDTMEVESEESDWNLFEASKLVKAFLNKGVKKSTPLVVYAEDVNAASRIAFAAYYLGVDQVKILDGGKKAWTTAGEKLTKKVARAHKVDDFGADVPGRKDVYIGDSDALLKAKEENKDLLVASVRSWKEYTGKTSGYNYIKNAGEIKGAVYAEASTTAYDLNYFTNEDGTLKDPTPVFKDWGKWGITADKTTAFYCGTGWRNCSVFFIAKQKGFDHVLVQDGGWYDWDLHHQKNPDKYPIQKGVSKELLKELSEAK